MVEIKINNEADEIIEKLFQSLKSNSEFFFDYAHLFYYKFHRTNLNHGGSYKINPINKKYK